MYKKKFPIKNFICVVEARMGSKRLPKKSLLNLDRNNKLIDYVIKNIQSSKYFNDKNIYLLTSESRNNKSLVKHVVKNYSIRIVIGSEKNVFSRYFKFKNKGNLPILRLTGDNPLIDPYLIDKFVEIFIKRKVHYMTTRAMEHSQNWKTKSSFPKGISLEAFYLKELFKKEKFFDEKKREFPTWFFFNKQIKVKIRKFQSFSRYKLLKNDLSFTIDTKEDYNRLKKFIKKNKCSPGENNLWNLQK